MTRTVGIDEVRRAHELFEPLTQSVRTLIDVTIRSRAADGDVARAHELIEEATALLSTAVDPDPFGVRAATDGSTLTWGNVAIGMRNAIAPPLVVKYDDTGSATVDFTLNAPYEGPTGLVHGGVCALVLDHVLGATAHRPGKPAFTGTLTLRYLAPTPLGRLRAEAWVETESESKTVARGHIKDPNGTITVEAEGIFIRPKAKS